MVTQDESETGIGESQREQSSTRRRILQSLGAGSVISLAGCASDGDSGDDAEGTDSGGSDSSGSDGSEGNEDTGGTTTPTESLTVRLGNIAPTSGPAGAYGEEILNATQLAADQAIEAGEVEDVEHVNGDSQYDPGQARSVAMEHVSDGVDVLHGAVSDAATIAISELADQEDLPHIGRSGNLTFDLRECRTNTFSFSPSIRGWTENGVGYCVRNGLGSKVYTIGYNFSWPQDHVQYLTEGFLPQSDAENVGVSLLELGTQDFAGPLTEAQDAGADILNLNMTGTGFLTALSQAKEFGFLDEGVVITNGAGNTAMGPGIDPEIRTYENFYLGLEWHQSIDAEAVQPFVQAFQNEYDAMPGVSVVHYVGVRTLLAAIGEAGSKNTGDVIDALEGRELKPQIWGEGETWRECDHRFKIPAVTSQGLPEGEDDFFEVVNLNTNYDQLTIPCDQTVCVNPDNPPEWFTG